MKHHYNFLKTKHHYHFWKLNQYRPTLFSSGGMSQLNSTSNWNFITLLYFISYCLPHKQTADAFSSGVTDVFLIFCHRCDRLRYIYHIWGIIEVVLLQVHLYCEWTYDSKSNVDLVDLFQVQHKTYKQFNDVQDCTVQLVLLQLFTVSFPNPNWSFWVNSEPMKDTQSFPIG